MNDPFASAELDALAELFDMTAPQARYVEQIDRSPVLRPLDGMAIVWSRSAVEEALRDPDRSLRRTTGASCSGTRGR